MQIGILKETNDKRVSIVPESVKLLSDSGNEVWVEKSAGEAAFFSDEEYKGNGAKITTREELLKKSKVIAPFLKEVIEYDEDGELISDISNKELKKED